MCNSVVTLSPSIETTQLFIGPIHSAMFLFLVPKIQQVFPWHFITQCLQVSQIVETNSGVHFH